MAPTGVGLHFTCLSTSTKPPFIHRIQNTGKNFMFKTIKPLLHDFLFLYQQACNFGFPCNFKHVIFKIWKSVTFLTIYLFLCTYFFNKTLTFLISHKIITDFLSLKFLLCFALSFPLNGFIYVCIHIAVRIFKRRQFILTTALCLIVYCVL